MTERTRAMAAHPAGKGRALEDLPELHELPELDEYLGVGWPLDPGPAALLARVTAAPLPQFEERVYELAYEIAELLIAKQADYGPHAISRAPGGALNGVLVRLHDKIERAKHLTRPGQRLDPQNEPLVDTFWDVAGYAVIALMVIEGTWPA